MNQTSLLDICARKHRNNSASKAANPNRQSKQLIQGQILELLAINGPLTGKEIAVMLGKQLNTISGRFSDLKAAGKVRGIGVRRDGAEVLERII